MPYLGLISCPPGSRGNLEKNNELSFPSDGSLISIIFWLVVELTNLGKSTDYPNILDFLCLVFSSTANARFFKDLRVGLSGNSLSSLADEIGLWDVTG